MPSGDVDAARPAEPLADGNPFTRPDVTARGPRLRPGPNRYAGFWWRALAALVDRLVLLPVTLIAEANHWWWHLPGVTGASLLAFPAYKIALEASGGTLGKRACGIMVIDGSARHPGFGRALSRNWPVVIGRLAEVLLVAFAGGILPVRSLRDPGDLAGLLAVLLPSLLVWAFIAIDALAIALSPRKRALHDRWAGTWCIRPRRADSVPPR